MTRIVVDLRGAQDIRHGERGISRYITDLSVAIAGSGDSPVSEWALDPDLPLPEKLAPLFSTGRLTGLGDDAPPDVFHVQSPFSDPELSFDGLFPRAFQQAGTRLVVTVYDLIPLLFRDRYLTNPVVRARYFQRLEWVRHADHVFAISGATRDDLHRHLGIPVSRVTVIGTGINDAFRRPPPPAAADAARAELPHLRDGFIMYTGGIDYRKNIPRLLTAYASLSASFRRRHQLVLVCKVALDEYVELRLLAQRLAIADDFLVTGYVSDQVLRHLYSTTALFVFPSLYEGFGLPVAEAMACGAPAIVGDNSSLVELMPESAARFDAGDERSIAEAIARGTEDAALRSRIRDAGRSQDHTWERVAETAIDAYRRIGARPIRRRDRPRVAFISPMPPAESGVADYNAPLVNSLVKHASVDVFCNDDADTPPIRGVSWFTYDDYPGAQSVRRYDAALFVIGNSTFHLPILGLLQEHGGIAVCHDVRLAGLFNHLAGIDRASLRPDERRVLEAAEEGSRQIRFDLDGGDVDHFTRLHHPLSSLVARCAGEIWVHSDYARTLASVGDGTVTTPVSTIPFGFSGRFAEIGREREQDGDGPATIVTMGIVAPIKQCEKLCHAFVELCRRDPDVMCAFVGGGDDETLRILRGIIDESGLGTRVLVTGRVSEDEYADWLRRATVSLQLRESSNGETSAAVGDCFEAGVPVITTGIGAANELPDGAVVHVARDITATDLADVVSRVVDDRDLRERLAERGLAFASRNTFDHVADVMVGRIGALARG